MSVSCIFVAMYLKFGDDVWFLIFLLFYVFVVKLNIQGWGNPLKIHVLVTSKYQNHDSNIMELSHSQIICINKKLSDRK